MSKIIATSDLHGHLPPIPECDILLIGGDLCPTSKISEQVQWLETTFKYWLNDIPAKEVVAIAGNHDFVFQEKPHLVPKLRWHYLQDEMVEIMGFKIWGTPWQPWFYAWAFNLFEPDLAKKFNKIPEGIDILVSHGPPQGFGDITRDRDHVGSLSLLKRILEVKPQLAVFGHIHESYGLYEHEGIIMANVSLVNSAYQPSYEPILFDLEPRK